jgi:hypothetical protein
MFLELSCPSSGGKIAFTQHMVSSLSVNGCTLHRFRADCRAGKEPRRRWEDNIKTTFKKWDGGMYWIDWAHDRCRWWAIVNLPIP